MPLSLEPFHPIGLNASLLATLIDEHQRLTLPRLRMLWRYYRNPMETLPGGLSSTSFNSSAGRLYRLAQERGLPARLTGASPLASFPAPNPAIFGPGLAGFGPTRREVVIENDIGWRIQAMIDFLFSKPVRLRSRARSSALRQRIDAALDECFQSAGGAAFLADVALLGHVYGHVDLLVRATAHASSTSESPDTINTDANTTNDTDTASLDSLKAAARTIRIELIEPLRGIPVVSPNDYRALDAYILHFDRAASPPDSASTTGNTDAHPITLPNLRAPSRHTTRPAPRPIEAVTEILGPDLRQLYVDRHDGKGPRLIEETPNTVSPGRTPVVHIQNVSQPFVYSGVSEVEPLIPLQDELNTRLSDRAFRVTMQSFKMYLAKGLDGFDQRPVGPGQLWVTDNPDAAISEFGGDASSPSEDSHINELREAFDKQSSLPPLATGVVRAKVGNLTSENALRLTLQGVLTRTARKRLAYGRGLSEIARLILAALNRMGALATTEEDREVQVDWEDALPQTQLEELAAAKAKVDLGIPLNQVLADLGETRSDTGIV